MSFGGSFATDAIRCGVPERSRGVNGGPSRVRTWDRPVMSRLL